MRYREDIELGLLAKLMESGRPPQQLRDMLLYFGIECPCKNCKADRRVEREFSAMLTKAAAA